MAKTDWKWIGISWDHGIWDLARSAYVADLDTDPECPVSFTGWLNRVLELHADRSAQDRVALAEQLTAAKDPRGVAGKSHRLELEVHQAIESAIVEDRAQLGRLVTRTGFAREAVLVAAADARRRLGRQLPPPPAGDLPNRPVRRR